MNPWAPVKWITGPQRVTIKEIKNQGRYLRCPGGLADLEERVLRAPDLADRAVALLREEAHLGATDCTPEINTLEIIVDVQWHFPMDFQWHVALSTSVLGSFTVTHLSSRDRTMPAVPAARTIWQAGAGRTLDYRIVMLLPCYLYDFILYN